MNIDNTSHQQIQQLLPLVPSGMLTDAERQQVDQHVAICEACRATLDQLIQADREMAELFAPVNPPLGFEERVLANWRPARFNISLRPGSRKVIAAAAAAILLGTVGYVGGQLMETNRLPGAAPLPHFATNLSTTKATPDQPRTVVELVKTAQQFTREGDFKQAQGVIQQILSIDPKNDYALGVRQLVAEQVALSDKSDIRGAVEEKRKIPYLEAMRYPDNWPEISETRDREVAGERGFKLAWGEGRDPKAAGAKSEGEARHNAVVQFSDMNSDFITESFMIAPAERQLGEKDGRTNAYGKTPVLGDVPILGRELHTTEGKDRSRTDVWDVAANGRGDGTLPGLGTSGGDVAVAAQPAVGQGLGYVNGGNLHLTGQNAGVYGWGTNNNFLGNVALSSDSSEKTAAKGGKSLDLGAIKIDDVAVKHNLATTAHFKPSQLSAWYFADGDVKRAGKDEKEKLAEVTTGVASYAGGTTVVSGVTASAASEINAATSQENEDLKKQLGVLKTRYDDSMANPKVAVQNNATAVEFSTPTGGTAAGTTVVTPEAPAPAAPDATVLQARKIIRNGDMEFEVESFDTAFATISRIVGEEKGYVSSTSSEKLPNGKVRGVIVVRVVPDRLDTLVLKLRALGDLKSQKISAQDITKVYYDLDSELRAAHTMQERILNIIKGGKGEVKDLIEAEKQLGTYREKIEKLEGEIRYYNNMVSLSTLNITAAEKAITSPATVQVTENVSTGIEAEDVEKARADAIKGIEELKGRVLDSNLKKYDGGQFAANITAEISPEASGQLIDRLRQIGRVTRLDVDRKQSSAGQALPNAPAPRVEKKDTRFVISIYNLANIAPRQTTTTSLAVANVEEAYKAILAGVKAHGGRVVSSSLNRQKPEQTTAALSFEVPGDQADATLLELRRDREVLTLTVAENPDTQNVTAAKHGFSLQLSSLASVAPRETETVVLVSKSNVTDAFRKLLADLGKADARILTSQLNEQDASNLSGSIDIEVTRAKEADARSALASAGVIFSRTVARSSDTENTVDSKIRLQVRMVGLNQLAPAQTARLTVETPDVETRAAELKDATTQLGGRVLDSRQATSATGQVSSRLILDVPLAKARDLREKAQNAGKVRTTDSTQNPVMLESPLARARVEVILTNASPIVSDNSGLGEAFRKAVATSVRGLLWSVQAIVIGALIVIPWAAILWGGWKVVRRKPATQRGIAATKQD